MYKTVLYIVPTILIMFIALSNFKRGFLLYLLFQMIWYPDTQLFKIGGSWINLNLISALYFVILYEIKYKKIKKKEIAFPYRTPMLCIGISLILTSLTSLSGFASEFVKAVGLIFMDILVVYVMWKTIDSKEDFSFLFKGITIIIFLACIYIFYEKITETNIVLDYKITCTSNKFETYRDFQQWDYRGYRCYSIFDHTICACMIFSLYIAVVLNLFIKKGTYPFRALSLITSFLCIPAMFFTQQRTGLFMLFIASLSIVDFRKKKFWKFIAGSLIVLVIVFPFIIGKIGLLLSMFSSKYAGAVSGSSASMRFDQLAAIFQIMLLSPITGLGENFQRFYTGVYAPRAMGYESLWFEQMAKHGMLGVLAYIFMIYYSVYVLSKRYKSKELLFISLAYWVTYTLTSTPYFRIYFLYAILFYYIKNSKVYLNKYN